MPLPAKCKRPGCDHLMTGVLAHQTFCSHSCASLGRFVATPRIPATRFDGLVKAHCSANSPVAALRLVLVDGKSQSEAAAATERSVQAVHQAMQRFLRRAGLAG